VGAVIPAIGRDEVAADQDQVLLFALKREPEHSRVSVARIPRKATDRVFLPANVDA
jgi:hypothetical protein